MENIQIEHNKDYEVGIFLCPDDALSYDIQYLTKRICKNHKAHGINLEQDKNHPHVTLFQLSVKGENIPKIYQSLDQVALDLARLPSVPLKPALSVVGRNVFWNIDALFQNPLLNKAQKNIVDMIAPLKSDKRMRQLEEKYNTLSDVQKEDVNQYGICWSLPHNFVPHFTVIYNMPSDFNLKFVSPMKQYSFKSAYLGVGLLGYHGNVIDVLWRVTL
ncbi:MAG: hypothetical protein Q8K36_06535 [Alphaproteobacteria bacterium]|nr:hypothetical protein [Alphaproteobacteria bacterium]